MKKMKVKKASKNLKTKKNRRFFNNWVKIANLLITLGQILGEPLLTAIGISLEIFLFVKDN